MLAIKHGKNKRADAAWVLFQILESKRSNRELMPIVWSRHEKPQDRAWLQEMIYGCLRKLPLLQLWLRQLLNKPLQKNQKIIEHLLMLGLYQLAFSRTAEHAAVSETVAACKTLKELRLAGLVNAVLREFQRQDLIKQEAPYPHISYGVPKWIYRTIKEQYSSDANKDDLSPTAKITLENMHARAPIWIRVNTLKISFDGYCKLLEQANVAFTIKDFTGTNTHAIHLQNAGDITALPGFDEGLFSVQDLAAQLAATFLKAKKDERILDCCAAPGGKSAAILEKTPNIKSLSIVDADASRMQKVHENFARLGYQKQFKEKLFFIVEDASALATSHKLLNQPLNINSLENGLFDKILVDAPCSATGIIRRHPDIMWLRKPSDIEKLVTLQSAILESAWKLLKSDGVLLYATCSIMPQENHLQIENFIAKHNDATLESITDLDGNSHTMWQILPGQHDMDGFFYAKLRKST